jgi:spore coat polysaccharide biosynthesis predicted glycosyltransferase SpsG
VDQPTLKPAKVRFGLNSGRPWLIRVASRPQDGAGHVSRCRALAKVLSRTNPVLFILDAEGEAWLPVLKADSLAATMDWERLDDQWAGSVLDGYDFPKDTAEELAANAAPLVVIDDFLTPPACAHLVINAAIHLRGHAVNGISALLGPRFALLNEQFSGLSARPVSMTVDHLVLTFGAIDPDNATGLSLEALALLDGGGFHPRVTVVVPPLSTHIESLHETAKCLGSQVTLLTNVRDMAGLLNTADLVVGAGGVSLLERMACSVPSVTIMIAENQRLSAEGAGQVGATRYVGPVQGLTAKHLADCIATLTSDYETRNTMAKCGRQLVDGQGAERVAEALRELTERVTRTDILKRQADSDS